MFPPVLRTRRGGSATSAILCCDDRSPSQYMSWPESAMHDQARGAHYGLLVRSLDRAWEPVSRRRDYRV